jgi:hypothetical protein
MKQQVQLVGHGLGAAPDVVIVKNRDTARELASRSFSICEWW